MALSWEEIKKMNRFRAGLMRLRANAMYIVQVGIAAGLSYWVGLHIFGHAQPFFAPMSTVIVLSTTGGERIRRSIELVLGVSIGVGLGDLIIAGVGSGVWQIAVAVSVSIALATVVDKGVLVANQAAFASVLIATILPPGTSGGTDRMLDAFIGGVVGLIVIAIVPESPLRSGRREIAKILGISAGVQRSVAKALASQNADAIADALTEARGTQGQINAMISAANMGKESISTSPLLWTQRRSLRSLIRILNPVDNVMRNTRVLARHALILSEDRDEVSPQQIELISRTAEATEALSRMFYGTTDVSAAVETPRIMRLLSETGRNASIDLVDGRVLSAYALLAQTRALIVDLQQICGMSRASAVSGLAPCSAHPASPDKLWRGENGAF
ncbi:aromatic acid exporter family protein [Corynebacterium kutscheri]|uniref:aromatic acid exporter family protein n=1 Tax=Corynebacterium kutscheri TaxID=35755 RepID=UPI0037C07B0F